jgi:hypothetical protein
MLLLKGPTTSLVGKHGVSNPLKDPEAPFFARYLSKPEGIHAI